MRREPIELAAVATAAVPGLSPTAVSSAPDDPADFDSALLLDSEGKRWRVRSPRHAEASTRLETEFLVLRAFSPAIRAELPFLMPTVAGTVRQKNLTTFVYSHLVGATRSVEEVTAGSQELAKEIGTALAAIHDLPRALVSNADLPSYTPNEFRQRRLNELDMAATTGKIPPLLLRRWEHAMEDVSLWRFNPCVVHGDLHEDNLLIEGNRVTAVTGWTDLRIGDPADDLAWLVASNEQDFVDAVVRHYTGHRRDVPDSHLLRRAALSAEFALAQYLVKGIATGDRGMVSEAEEMLATLADDIAQHGGQPISVEPLPQPAAPTLVPAAAGAPAANTAPAASPGLIPVPAATDVSEQMPAVHVMPIPTEDAGQPADSRPDSTANEDNSAGAAGGDSGRDTDGDGGTRATRAGFGTAHGSTVIDAHDKQHGSGAEDGNAGQDGDAVDGDAVGGDAVEDRSAVEHSTAESKAALSPDDTSTTALTIVDAKTH